MNVSLIPMTKQLCRGYYMGFERDEAVYMDTSLFEPFVYSDTWADAYFDRQILKHRIFLAVISDGAVVGELILKDIDREAGECTLSIHLQNDSVKGRGIGTQAERLALSCAFSKLGMEAVKADTVLKNKRSQHILEKLGFRFLYEQGIFRYYRCDKDDFTGDKNL